MKRSSSYFRSKDPRKANLGDDFETLLGYVHAAYQEAGVACVRKMPTEFIPIRDYSGRVVDCKVERKSDVDYLGRYKSIPVAVEAKHTDESRILFSRVKPHQAEFMDVFTSDPHAAGIVVVSFGLKRFFAVPWEFWDTARALWGYRIDKNRKGAKAIVEKYGYRWESPGMASVSADELLPEWEFKLSHENPFYLPYLSIVDRMMGWHT